MIDSLTGILVRKEPVTAVIDVGGVGYFVHITLHTFETLPDVGERISLLTYLHVREDAMQLYAFLEEQERTLFGLLHGISGIGPKMAMNILSGCGAAELQKHISSGNVAALTSIPGIGRKTAERIVVELRDKLAKLRIDVAGISSSQGENLRLEAILALVSLGYSRLSAEKSVANVLSGNGGEFISSGEIIKIALKTI